MVYERMDAGCVDDGEPGAALESTAAEQPSPVSLLSPPLCCEMSIPMLAAQCLRELDNYRRGQPCTDMYGVELLRRATIQDDQQARAGVQHCFSRVVRGWLRCHPKREEACHLESEEHYVAQAFERFWQATASNPRREFSTIAAALLYLRASLNGAILDTLRVYARPGEVSLPEPGEAGEPQVEESTDSSAVWDILHTILSSPREQRLAYLLFHCGLKPWEIVRFCPQEWSDLQEIYCLRRTIMERLLGNADHLRWR